MALITGGELLHAQEIVVASAQDGTKFETKPVPEEELPQSGTFWSLQLENPPPWPCFPPFLRKQNLPIYLLDAKLNVFLIDDTTFDWKAEYERREVEKALRQFELESGLREADEWDESEGQRDGPVYDYSSGDLWIEILRVESSYAYLTLHGTIEGGHYQLEYTNRLSHERTDWTLGEIITGATGTNQTDFQAVFVDTNAVMFFRAHYSDPVIRITFGRDAIEPNSILSDPGQTGIFYLSNFGSEDAVVHYRVSGSALGGIDYSNLTGVVTVTPGGGGEIDVQAIADNLIEGAETVIVELVHTNSYLIDQFNYAKTLAIRDSSMTVRITRYSDTVETNGPPGAAAVIGSFTVYRDDDRGLFPELAVRYSISGTASNGTDYGFLSGTLIMPAGVMETNLDIIPVDDALAEGIETVILTLIPTNTYLIYPDNSAATNQIYDSSSTVRIDGFASTGIEPDGPPGEPAQTASFVISRSDILNLSPALTVQYVLSGTAINGVDYANLPGTVTIPAGASFATVFIQPLADNVIEGTDSVVVSLTNLSDGYLINSNFWPCLDLVDSVGVTHEAWFS